jgi:hypothetical protein
VLVFSIPAVQTKLGSEATKWLNENFDTHISIKKVGLQFNGDVELKEIYIEDFKKDTLISAQELNTSILNFPSLYKGQLVFGDIDLIDVVLNIKTYKDAEKNNLSVFIEKLSSKKQSKKKISFLLSSSDVSIYNGKFNLVNENIATSNILNFSNVNINATRFLINGTDVSMRVNTLSFKDQRGIKVKNLMTNFKYTVNDMTFEDLEIKTQKSVLSGHLKFFYERENLKYFTDKVTLRATFRNSEVLLDELNTFYNEFGKHQFANFNVDLSGTLNNLNAENLQLKTSKNTAIYGNIKFKNLFSITPNDFVMDGNFTNLKSTYKDLKALLPNVLGKAIPSTFDRLGKFKITGTSKVTASKVDADIQMVTDLGFVDTDLHITKLNDIDNASYKGNIILDTFNLGTFIDDPKVGEVSLNLDVKGRGFIAETVDTQVKGNVYQLNYNNYNYNKTIVSGKIRNKIFDGILLVNDENLKLKFNGLFDYSEAVNKYDFKAEVDYADLNTLNFVTKDSLSILKSTVSINMNSSSLDDAYGDITFRNTSYTNQNDVYRFKEFKIASEFKEGIRYVAINSPDIIQGGVSGNFKVRDIGKLFQNAVGNIYTNYKPHKVANHQTLDFDFRIYNKIIEVFYPDIEIGRNTFVRGSIESEAQKFKLTFKSPQIRLLNNFAKNIDLQVDNSNPLFNTYVEVDSINTKYYNASKFSLINVTVNDTLFMRSEFTGGKRNNDKFNLSFYHTIDEKNNSVVGFKTSDVTIKDYKWNIN